MLLKSVVFLGLAGYYRKFIEGFLELALPFTKLTRKGQMLFGILNVRKDSKS